MANAHDVDEARERSDLAHAWQELIDQLRESEKALLAWRGDGPFRPLDLAEGYRFVMHSIRYGIDLMLESDPERPQFVLMADDMTKMFGDNADAIYHYTHISGADGARYRIKGKRGDVAYLSFQVYRGKDRSNPSQPTVDDINYQRIDFAPDGSFEVLVGGPPQPRNYVGLSEDAASLIVRAYYFDRATLNPATYTIERITPMGPRPPWSLQEMSMRLRHVAAFIKGSERMRPVQVKQWNAFENPFRFTKDMAGWGTVDSTYCRCFYKVEADEALIIEGETVAAPYWGFQLWNIHSQSLDFRHHRASLNSRTIKLEPNGRFRAVIAHSDPGVPNWLDAAGHHIGFVFVRWLIAEKMPVKPTVKLVKLADVKKA